MLTYRKLHIYVAAERKMDNLQRNDSRHSTRLQPGGDVLHWLCPYRCDCAMVLASFWGQQVVCCGAVAGHPRLMGRNPLPLLDPHLPLTTPVLGACAGGVVYMGGQ